MKQDVLNSLNFYFLGYTSESLTIEFACCSQQIINIIYDKENILNL